VVIPSQRASRERFDPNPHCSIEAEVAKIYSLLKHDAQIKLIESANVNVHCTMFLLSSDI
jgi:hypothetical protein